MEIPARLRKAPSFNRVGNAPRSAIYPAGRCERGPLGTRLNELYFKWLELRWVSCLTRLVEKADIASRGLLYESG